MTSAVPQISFNIISFERITELRFG
ncbi:hypothetical protein MED222_05360 [Vibrio sp. MED222]|nr:hypothetical protein MED222_05360 [Vibrio sp. MED222]